MTMTGFLLALAATATVTAFFGHLLGDLSIFLRPAALKEAEVWFNVRDGLRTPMPWRERAQIEERQWKRTLDQNAGSRGLLYSIAVFFWLLFAASLF